MNGWISVEDDVPRHTGVCDGTTDDVLVLTKRYYHPGITVGYYEWAEDGLSAWHCHHFGVKSEEVIAWQYLPEGKI